MTKQKHLFLLEDEAMTRMVMLQALQSAGYKVTTAENVAEARPYLRKPETFDLLVMNVVLPDGDGIELCGEARRNGVTCPILVETGHQVDYILSKSLRYGVNDILNKPFSDQDLISRIELLLEFPQIMAEYTASFIDYTQNQTQISNFVGVAAEKVLSKIDAIAPVEGSYPEHPFVDGNSVPTLPFTENEIQGLRQLILDAKKLHDGHVVDAGERSRIIAAAFSFFHTLATWLAGRGTVVVDETLKGIVKVTAVTYMADALGLKDALIKLIVGMMSSGGISN
jgi:CheY-like chemotaxis protein